MQRLFAVVVLALAVVGAAVADTQADASSADAASTSEWYTPPAEVKASYTLKPVMTKPKNLWQSNKPIRKANIVTKGELQNIIEYDYAALQRSVSRAQRMKRMRSGETARPKLLPAHYHTSNLVSPTQEKVTADVAGSTGDFVTPDVIGKAPRDGPASTKPRFVAPTFVAPSKKPLSKPATTRVNGPRVHYHHSRHPIARARRAARKFPRKFLPRSIVAHQRNRAIEARLMKRAAKLAARANKRHARHARRHGGRRHRRVSRRGGRRGGRRHQRGPHPPRPLARRSALAARRARRAHRPQSRRARRAAAIASRRAQIRRASARRAAAVVARARARSPSGKPIKQANVATQTPIKPADVREADKEARQLADTAATVKAIKVDTSSLVMGQKQLVDYARTATRSNPIAERGVKLDEQILRHIDRLEKELSAMAQENRAMRSLQRANLEQLKALNAKQTAAAAAAAPAKAKATPGTLAARVARNIKSFPHLRAVAVSITEDTDSANVADVERFAQVHAEDDSAHERVVDEFHASLSAGHDTEAALDAAIAEQLSDASETHTEVQHTEAEAGAADAGAKSEEEVAMEKLMGMAGSFLQSADEAEAESETETEATEEAEESDESEEESEDESESEDEEEADEESEDESEDEAEAEDEEESEADDEDEGEEEGEAEVDAEDAEAVALIDADSTTEMDIIRLAEHNAALVEQATHRVMAQAESESASRTHASAQLDVEVADEAAADSEAAAALGLPEVPHSVPTPVHDDLTEVAAEVEAEYSAHRVSEQEATEQQALAEAEAAIAEGARFQQIHSDSEDADAAADAIEDEAEAEVDAEHEGDAEFAALMSTAAAEDAEVNSEIEHDLANEDAADVDIASEVVDETLEDAAMDTTEAVDSASQNKDVAGLQQLVAQLSAELGAAKAQGEALANEH